MKYITTIASLLIFIAYQPSLAASFDCKDATTNVEVMVCNNEHLSKLDEDLAFAFNTVRNKSSEFLSDHTNWLSSRNLCNSVECIENYYIDRIFAIKSLDIQSTESDEGLINTADESEDVIPLDNEASYENHDQPQVADNQKPIEPEAIVNSKDLTNDEPKQIKNSINDDGTSESFFSFGNIAFGAVIAYLSYLFFGGINSCPSCKKLFSGKQFSKELLSRDIDYKTIVRTDEHKNATGSVVGTTKRKEQVRIERKNFLVTYVCKKCKHKWTANKTEESELQEKGCDMEMYAKFSECGNYRYHLNRKWSDGKNIWGCPR